MPLDLLLSIVSSHREALEETKGSYCICYLNLLIYTHMQAVYLLVCLPDRQLYIAFVFLFHTMLGINFLNAFLSIIL